MSTAEVVAAVVVSTQDSPTTVLLSPSPDTAWFSSPVSVIRHEIEEF